VTRRHRPYDRAKDELAAQVQADAAEGTLAQKMADVNAWLAELQDQGVHMGVAVGTGPLLCVCGSRWPCAQTRADVPSSR
jgi:hypothetical protein